MKVRAIKVDGKTLPQRYYDMGNTKQAEFSGIKLGNEYLVYGMSLFRGCLHFLINASDEVVNPSWNPSWNPAAIFEVVEHSIPKSWLFNYMVQNEEYSVAAIWGYKELVLSEKHYDGLIEREAEDIILFAKNMKLSHPDKESDEDNN